ncbi:MAG TPA: hypothetical protein VGH19_16075 [Verrucomicrobiae bacterium]
MNDDEWKLTGILVAMCALCVAVGYYYGAKDSKRELLNPEKVSCCCAIRP